MCESDKPMTQRPESMDSSSPKSTRVANDVFAACGHLSSDGAAAVLAYARTMVEKNRRAPATLQNLEIWSFARIVDVAASEIKDVVYLKERRFRREFVFVASVHRHLQARGDAGAMSLAAFKARVLEAQANGMMVLERCRNTTDVSPLLVEASTVQAPRGPCHLIERDGVGDMRHALENLTSRLPESARATVASFARRVHADEALRDGRPRLITLEPEKFAARIQEFVDREADDVPITTLFWKLEDRGEMTGLDIDSFKARLLTAFRAGRLQLGTQAKTNRPEVFFMQMTMMRDDAETWFVVRRSNVPPPIPWGPPLPPIIRRLVLNTP
jgi:hypothetical protein